MNNSYKNSELLHRLYIEERKSACQIAIILNCSCRTVYNYLEKFGIPIRSKSESVSGKYNPRYTPLEERFWCKVKIKGKNDCWLWIAGKNDCGYGEIRKNGVPCKAHRVSWELANGRNVPIGLFVCHHCDKPGCVNPSHLFLGTHQDNMADMVNKGRSQKLKGEKHNMAKLTEKQVVEIISKYKTGNYSQRKLAKEYKVAKSTIHRTVNGHSWQHLFVGK